jgi:hypothetical protein
MEQVEVISLNVEILLRRCCKNWLCLVMAGRECCGDGRSRICAEHLFGRLLFFLFVFFLGGGVFVIVDGTENVYRGFCLGVVSGNVVSRYDRWFGSVREEREPP